MLVSSKNRRLSFDVSVRNRKENAYNTRVIATYSKNLFYASITPPVSVEQDTVVMVSGGYLSGYPNPVTILLFDRKSNINIPSTILC